ncbi:hypothetical protein ACLOJK_041304 [Asimina triloba]
MRLFLRFAASLLVLGLAFRFLFSDSIGFSPASDPPFLRNNATAFVAAPAVASQRSASDGEFELEEARNDKCDLFTGEWIPNPSGPVYNNQSCHFIEEHQNCMKNGRPDTAYLYWKWKPRDCELPFFDPLRFLEAMRSKSWALIGDSISRNHVQSLLCTLSTVEEAVQVYHDAEHKSKTWHFNAYNFTLAVVWSPFLVKSAVFEDVNGVSTADPQLYLDTLDNKWTDQYGAYDFMIISGGKWFLKTAIYYENGKVVGCHYCPGKNLKDLGFEYSYRKALHLLLNFVATSNHKGMILFRTSTPDHFENGEWFSGGACERKAPAKEGEIDMKDVHKTLRAIELEEFKKASAVAAKRGVNLKLLDTIQLTLLRPDGHPGPYRLESPVRKCNCQDYRKPGRKYSRPISNIPRTLYIDCVVTKALTSVCKMLKRFLFQSKFKHNTDNAKVSVQHPLSILPTSATAVSLTEEDQETHPCKASTLQGPKLLTSKSLKVGHIPKLRRTKLLNECEETLERKLNASKLSIGLGIKLLK